MNLRILLFILERLGHYSFLRFGSFAQFGQFRLNNVLLSLNLLALSVARVNIGFEFFGQINYGLFL